MQPPPRKGTHSKVLKHVHSEQLARLQAKNAHECDLLEDIRSYTKQRSAIEKTYAEALLKVSSSYLNRKIPSIPEFRMDDSDDVWNVWNVWRTVLEENERLAKARLAAVEVFQQQIADDAKGLRTHKLAAGKKCSELMVVMHKELQTCVQDLDKTKKVYSDEEHTTKDVRDKARDAEEKLKKKKGSLFQSFTSLQKNTAKFCSKRDQLEEKSTAARNDYLLALAAANAHQTRYFAVDMQQTIRIMEADVYERFRDYLNMMGRTELLTCSAAQTSFIKIRDQAQNITRQYNVQCVLNYYPVLKQHIQYDFEPCEGDTVTTINPDHNAEHELNKEARRWASSISKDGRIIVESKKKLAHFQMLRDSGQKNDPDDVNGPDLETKLDDLREAVRQAETSKIKSEARIEYLREGGVSVDEWLKEVETLSTFEIPRSASGQSMREESAILPTTEPVSDSFYDSDFNDASSEVSSNQPKRTQQEQLCDGDEAVEEGDDDDVDDDRERQRNESLGSGWDDPTQVDWGEAPSLSPLPPMNIEEEIMETEQVDEVDTEAAPEEPWDPSGPAKCVALYNYEAQNPDELSILESEQLEVLGEGDGDGWLRCRNYKGEEGFVPNNYVEIEGAIPMQSSSFSSVDYALSEEQVEDEGFPVPDDEVPPPPPPPNIEPPEIDVEPAHVENFADFPPLEPPSTLPLTEGGLTVESAHLTFCKALYDYEATSDEELSFFEGDVVEILNRKDEDDDGWWEGRGPSGAVGHFPSLMVELCAHDGRPLTPMEGDYSPPDSAPPVFTPPEVPPFLLPPEKILVMQPTPTTETADEEDDIPPPDLPPVPTSTEGFEMEMPSEVKDTYKTQFDQQNGAPQVEVTITEDEATEEEHVTGDSSFKSQKASASISTETEDGLGIAQIVITAATPMVEEPDTPFPPPPEVSDAPSDDNGNPMSSESSVETETVLEMSDAVLKESECAEAQKSY